MTTSIDLNRLDPLDYRNRDLTDEEILAWFVQERAYWTYKGGPSSDRPHGEMTSGACSNAYFDTPRVLKHPPAAEILGRQLGRKLWRVRVETDCVVSSAYSAITFGHEVAKELGVDFYNVEKDPTDPDGKRMVFKKQPIPAGFRVLQVEELSNSIVTMDRVREAIEEGNPDSVEFLSVAATGVLRPPKLLPVYSGKFGGRTIIALIERDVPSWAKQSECPYCRVSSPRYNPKTHWAELTGKR